MTWWAHNPGHVLILPKYHIKNIYTMPDDILAEIAVLSKLIAIAQKIAFRCDGTSTRQHNEPAGYQHIWHFHHHVVPRWQDDNFYHLSGEMVPPSTRRPYAELLRAELNRTNSRA